MDMLGAFRTEPSFWGMPMHDLGTLPPVSVILAVYNGERYLAAAIESILAQTHGQFEFIIVNDGSTDSTAEILAEYARRDLRIRVVSQSNQDQPRSLNRALAIAQYEWVAVIDHDDVSLPCRLETQLCAAMRNPDIRVIGTYATEISADGRELRLREASPTTIEGFDLLRRSGGWMSLVHPSVMMHRQTVLDLGGYDPRFGAAADSELWSRVADQHLVLSLPVPLVRYRVHEGSMSFTRFHEQRRAVRWLRARQTARWQNQAPPTLDEFLHEQRGIRVWRTWNYCRQDWVQLCEWRAQLARAAGRGPRASMWDVSALVLAPRRAFRLARARFRSR